MRDYALETTFDVKFTTRRFSTGAPFTLAGTPVISAYVGNSLTQITAGITLTVDFDGVTGLNNVRVVATSANGYAAGSNYALVITTGTVDSVSVVGEVVAEFSLEAQSPLRPTVANRTLDVSAGGEGGLDWANVGSPTTVVGLSGTTVKTATDVETDTAEIGVAGAWLTNINLPNQTMDIVGNITGNLSDSVGSVTAGGSVASGIKKNATLIGFEFLMTDSTNHNPVTGKTVTVTRSIDDGAFAAGTLSAVTEIAFGIYAVDFGAGDLNGRVITLRATAAGCG